MDNAYLSYLKKLRIDNASEFRDYTKTTLAEFIRMYYDKKFTTISDNVDANYYRKVRNEISKNAEMRRVDDSSNGEIYRALKVYANFLSSSFNPHNKPNMNDDILVSKHRKYGGEGLNNEETIINNSLSEGAVQHIESEKHMRNPKLRQQCLESWGYQCQCCGFDFSKAYGEELGSNFIEVHHLRPISTYDQEHQVDPEKDLVPLCSNCHSMIHRGKNGVLTLHELRASYKGKSWTIEKFMPDGE